MNIFLKEGAGILSPHKNQANFIISLHKVFFFSPTSGGKKTAQFIT